MTKTGGRSASLRHIMGNQALSVGMPRSVPPPGWRWVALTDVARLESGHTPSRKHKGYWGGETPWLSIRDAKAHHGGTIERTIETTNDLGIANSSARVLPKGTVCLSRTASVGYVVIMGCPMATSQDFVNWVCSKHLDPRFLQYLLISEARSLSRFSSGAVHQTIYFPEAKAFHICMPEFAEQQRIVAMLDEALAAITTATANAEKNLANVRNFFDALLEDVVGSAGGEPTTFGSATDIKVGFAFKSGGYTSKGDDIPLIRGDNVIQGRLRWDDVKRWPRNQADEYGAYHLEAGDVLLAMDRTWVKSGLKYAVLGPEDVPSLLVQRVARLRAKDVTSSEFIAFQVAAPAFTRYVLGIQTGLGVPHISGKQIADYRFCLPSSSKQLQVIETLNAAKATTARGAEIYSNKLDELDNLKQSLLDRAFSGEPVQQVSLAA